MITEAVPIHLLMGLLQFAGIASRPLYSYTARPEPNLFLIERSLVRRF